MVLVIRQAPPVLVRRVTENNARNLVLQLRRLAEPGDRRRAPPAPGFGERAGADRPADLGNGGGGVTIRIELMDAEARAHSKEGGPRGAGVVPSRTNELVDSGLGKGSPLQRQALPCAFRLGTVRPAPCSFHIRPPIALCVHRSPREGAILAAAAARVRGRRDRAERRQAVKAMQLPACDHCTQGVMDATNNHYLGVCSCPCHYVGCSRCGGTGQIPAGPFGGGRDSCPTCGGRGSVPR